MGFFDELKSAFKEGAGIPDDMSIGEGLKQEFLKNIKGEEEDDDDFDDEDDYPEDEEESDAIFCSNCGKPMEAGSRFCPKCGTPVAEEEEEEPDDDPADVGEFLTIAYSKFIPVSAEFIKTDWLEFDDNVFSSEADSRITGSLLMRIGAYIQNMSATSEMMVVANATEDSTYQTVAAYSIKRYYDLFSKQMSATQVVKGIDVLRDEDEYGEIPDTTRSLVNAALAEFKKCDGYFAWFTEIVKQFVPDDN